MKAVIIAAGQSSRLWKRTKRTPKTLLPFGKGTILSTIIENLGACGVEEFVVVVGWKKEQIQAYLDEQNGFGGRVRVVEHEAWDRGNGLSVLATRDAVGQGPFLLSMSDHIVSPEAVQLLASADSSKNLLLVDRRVEAVFDIDDATKVQVEGDAIVGIGKTLSTYNGIDCGVFRLDHRFFAAMEARLKEGQESISAAVTGLIEQQAMGAVFMHETHTWIDIDTPEAYHHALGDDVPSEASLGATPR